MTYSVTFSKPALKKLGKVSEPYFSNIKSAIQNLAKNPRPPGYKKLKNRDGFRIRVGTYRIIYEIFDTELIVEVITVGHRKDIY